MDIGKLLAERTKYMTASEIRELLKWATVDVISFGGGMMLSSSSVLALRFSQALPENARGIALSLTTLEDAVLFFALSLLLGGGSFANLPIALAVLAALSLAALAIFSQVYKYIVGREYALPFAIAMRQYSRREILVLVGGQDRGGRGGPTDCKNFHR